MFKLLWCGLKRRSALTRCVRPVFICVAAALGVIAILAGCNSVTVKGDPWINKAALDRHAPFSIAILPTTDRSGHPELKQPMRDALYNAISVLPYQDISLEKIDATLAHVGERMGLPPEQLPAEAAALPEFGDCVVFSEIADVSRLYLLLYARTRIDLNFAIADTKTREILYRNHFRLYARSGGPSITLLGMVERAVESLWNLRGEELPDALLKGARQIAAEIPAPAFKVAGGPTLQITDVRITTPRKPMGVGDRVILRVMASPHSSSSFSIGKLVRDAPLHEVQPGEYHGLYQVQAGDNAPYAVAAIHLESADGQTKLEYVADKQPFAIDTQAPAVISIQKWWNDGRDGIYLSFKDTAPPPTADSGYAAIARYFIYRRDSGQLDYFQVGTTTEPQWHDETVVPGHSYEYYLQTEDTAGNTSLRGPTSRITIPAHNR